MLIPYRGCCVVLRKDTRLGMPKWHEKDIAKRMKALSRGKYKQDMDACEYLDILRSMPGYITDFYFEDFTKEEEKLYNNVLRQNKYDTENNLELSDKDVKLNAVKGLYNNGFNNKSITEILKIPHSSISRYTRILKERGEII